jgi:hypothetical protein
MNNLITVTKEEFYKALYADPRDIMPTIVNSWRDDVGYIQEWRSNKGTGLLFGITSGNREKVYQLVR